MDTWQIQKRVAQILAEERAKPTVDYKFEENAVSNPFVRLGVSTYFRTQRQGEKKEVHEDTSIYKFASVNHEMLAALASQVSTEGREVLQSALCSSLASGVAFRTGESFAHPNWYSYISESALIAEFMVRHGDRPFFFRVLAESSPSATMVPLLAELQDFLAYNWRALSETELEQLGQAVQTFWRATRVKETEFGKSQSVAAKSYSQLAWRIGRLSKALIEQCRKAAYLHLKGSLLQGLNLEVNQDKTEVESYLTSMGFSSTLLQSLNHAEQLYRSPSPFELKSSMGHLRSFLEKLHMEAAARCAAKHGEQSPTKWGEIVLYLRNKGVLSKAQEGFVIGLYTLLSDTAVHPLIAEREYARLSRNVVVEYGLLLLTQLQKAGF